MPGRRRVDAHVHPIFSVIQTVVAEVIVWFAQLTPYATTFGRRKDIQASVRQERTNGRDGRHANARQRRINERCGTVGHGETPIEPMERVATPTSRRQQSQRASRYRQYLIGVAIDIAGRQIQHHAPGDCLSSHLYVTNNNVPTQIVNLMPTAVYMAWRGMYACVYWRVASSYCT